MRSVQKLVRNGNSTQLTIIRQMLVWLGWLPGEPVVVEVMEDKSLRVRRLTLDDTAPKQMRPLFDDRPETLQR